MKLLKRLLIGLLVLAALIYFVAIPYLHKETKKFSPARTATMDFGGSNLEVDYSSPTKKDRVVFGNLVPYGEVWRTGANEPTTFSNSNKIMIIDKMLPAGTYSLWTIPNKESWKIIFNTEVPSWGVTRVNGNQTTREAHHDYLTVEIPIVRLEEPIEEFSISFEKVVQNKKTQHYLTMSWDTTKIMVPINK